VTTKPSHSQAVIADIKEVSNPLDWLSKYCIIKLVKILFKWSSPAMSTLSKLYNLNISKVSIYYNALVYSSRVFVLQKRYFTVNP